MQLVSSRIWTRVAVSISYDDNDYTTGTSINTIGGRLRFMEQSTRKKILNVRPF